MIYYHAGRASAQQIKHIFLEAGLKFLEYPANLQQQYHVTLPSSENNLKYNVFYNIFEFCTQLETLTLRNIVMSNRVRIPKVKNQSLIRIRLEIQDGAFAIEDVVVSGSSALLPLHFLLGLHRLVMTDCQWSALNWIDLTNSVLDNFTWKMTKEQAMGGRIRGGRSPTTADVKTVISVEDTISQLEGQNLYYMMDQQNGFASCTRAHMKRYIEGRRSSVNDPCIYLGFKCEFIRSITVISPSFEKTLLVHPL